jgi:cytochrome c-type biogenesis protein CcmH
MTDLRVRGSAVVVAIAALIMVSALGVVSLREPVTTSPHQQAQEIAAGLRCPVCKDLSAADSPAPLARQMRRQIEEQVAAGVSAREIEQRFVAAYGPSVLLTPPARGWGRAVHLLPLAVLGVAVLAGSVLVRRGLRAAKLSREEP